MRQLRPGGPRGYNGGDAGGQQRGKRMSIAQSYVMCFGVSIAAVAVALIMLVMGTTRRGAADLDDGAAMLLNAGGLLLLFVLACLWFYAWPMIPAGFFEKLLR